jgi:hypothetical protein
LFLTKAERDFLPQRGEISKNMQRYIRYKLRKKIKHFYNSRLPLLIDQGYIIAGVAANSCGVAAGSPHNNNSNNKKSAGSGNFVPFIGSSNPRVLSDMGLAIPRPTRLGDPRSVTRGSLSNIILTSLIPLFLFKTSWLSWLPAATPFVLAATQPPLAADDDM